MKTKKKQHKLSTPVTNHRLQICIWLVNLLTINKDGLTRKQINEEYQRHIRNTYGHDQVMLSQFPVELERRTFYNYCLGVSELLGVVIECGKGFRYKLTEGTSDNVTQWMLDSFATSEALMQTRDIRNRILLEDIPSGNRYLSEIIQAIRKNRQIAFKYKDYTDECPRLVTGDPYCIKIYHQRWYVVVKETLTDAEIGKVVEEKHVYSLDRMLELSTLATTFKLDSHFDAEEFFFHAFAVRVEKNNPPRVIKIKVLNVQVPYFEDLPLHHSQTLVERTDEYSIYILYCAITIELIMQLMYYGPLVEVLSPDEVREQMAARVYWMARAYEVDQDIIEEYLDETE